MTLNIVTASFWSKAGGIFFSQLSVCSLEYVMCAKCVKPDPVSITKKKKKKKFWPCGLCRRGVSVSNARLWKTVNMVIWEKTNPRESFKVSAVASISCTVGEQHECSVTMCIMEMCGGLINVHRKCANWIDEIDVDSGSGFRANHGGRCARISHDEEEQFCDFFRGSTIESWICKKSWCDCVKGWNPTSTAKHRYFFVFVFVLGSTIRTLWPPFGINMTSHTITITMITSIPSSAIFTL